MFTTLGRAFRTPELRNRLLLTIFIMAVFRLGSHIPTPGVSYTAVQQCQPQGAQGSNALLGMANMFSGGALLQLSIFALGIMPYITASIIVQLLTVVIPRFETLKQEGQSGQSKLTQYTRFITIGLALLQASTFITFARNPATLFPGSNCEQILVDDTLGNAALAVLTMTAGTGLVMWLGELITERGVGNGMSLLIFTSIAAGFPSSLWSVQQQQQGRWDTFVLIILMGLAIIGVVVFVEQCQRRIPVQYAKRMVGRRVYGGTSTYIPLKINQANVIPVIFASSLLALPALAVQFQAGNPDPPGWVVWVSQHLVQGDSPWYMAIYTALIVFFTFFYVSISFNTEEVADNMKKYGGFIPGVRAGRPTAQYLSYVVNRITVVGALYLAIVALIPLIALVTINANQNFPFGGTSILIMVGVGLETVKQIESRLKQHHYEGLLR